MLNTILQKIKSNLEDIALQAEGNENKFTVRFVDPNNGEETLYPNAINIALFGSIAEKDIMGNATFSVPTSGNLGIAQKAPLKLSIDILLLFNFTNYATAIDCYGQVLGYFYNNDIMNVPFDGYDTRVEVLLSSFNDRNEIEIWNSFNTPGIPMLRYYFRYVLISGRVEQLPVVRNVSLDADIVDAAASEIDAMILNFIYYPIEDIVQGIVQKTLAFCSINLVEDESDEIIETRYNELIDSYSITVQEINDFKKGLKASFSTDPTMKKEFSPFIPAISGLQLLLKKYAKELVFLGKDTIMNYTKICVLAKSNIEGENRGLSLLLLQQLTTATEYLEITTNINTQILSFVTVGDSVYIPLGTYPYNVFKESQQLSLLQLQKKWWDLEDLLKQTKACYAVEKESSLLDDRGVVYTNFIALLKNCGLQINEPINKFTKLNEKYNNRNTEITAEIKEAYLKAYTDAYQAINYIDSESIVMNLTKSLQYILIKQSTHNY